jgi:NitT/TauT family transport system substrate-binding protein
MFTIKMNKNFLVSAFVFGCFFLTLECTPEPSYADGPLYAGQIAVPNYGSGASAMPWAIALKKGFFQDQNINITGIIASAGGSNDVRNLIAGNLIYAESAMVPVLRAIQGGADLKIVDENVHTLAEFVWITKKDSSINSLSDLKGQRISFTTPLSSSQLLDEMLLKKEGLTNNDAQLIAIGAFGAALTALQNGGVDVALIPEPLYTLNKGRFRKLVWSWNIFPAISNVIGVTSAKNAKKHPDVLRGILLAHRQAVDFMRQHPKESAAIIANVYRMKPEVVEQVMQELLNNKSTDGVTYFSEGDIDAKGVDTLMAGAYSTGMLQEKINWRNYVDQDFLPTDLKRNLN